MPTCYCLWLIADWCGGCGGGGGGVVVVVAPGWMRLNGRVLGRGLARWRAEEEQGGARELGEQRQQAGCGRGRAQVGCGKNDKAVGGGNDDGELNQSSTPTGVATDRGVSTTVSNYIVGPLQAVKVGEVVAGLVAASASATEPRKTKHSGSQRHPGGAIKGVCICGGWGWRVGWLGVVGLGSSAPPACMTCNTVLWQASIRGRQLKPASTRRRHHKWRWLDGTGRGGSSQLAIWRRRGR